MPFSNEVRVPLLRVLTALRRDWSDAEVGDATRLLAEQDGHPCDLVLQAVVQARKASNERAVTITFPVQAEAVVRSIAARLPGQRVCPTHFGVAVNPVTGEFVCCEQERAGDPEPRAPRSPSRPGVEALRLLEQARTKGKQR